MSEHVCTSGVVRTTKGPVYGSGGVANPIIKVVGGIDSVVRTLHITELPITKVSLDNIANIREYQYDLDAATWNHVESKTIGLSSNYISNLVSSSTNTLVSITKNTSGFTITHNARQGTESYFDYNLRVFFADDTSLRLPRYLFFGEYPYSITLTGICTISDSTNLAGWGANWIFCGNSNRPATYNTGTTYTMTINSSPNSSTVYAGSSWARFRPKANTTDTSYVITNKTTVSSITINGTSYPIQVEF